MLTTVQVPWDPTTLHWSQAPAQGVLQHKPSTQLPELHCVVRVQLCPTPSTGTHAPPAPQKLPLAQSPSPEQLDGQAPMVPEQTNAPQLTPWPTGVHVPPSPA